MRSKLLILTVTLAVSAMSAFADDILYKTTES